MAKDMNEKFAKVSKKTDDGDGMDVGAPALEACTSHSTSTVELSRVILMEGRDQLALVWSEIDAHLA